MKHSSRLINAWRLDMIAAGLVAFAGFMTSLTCGNDNPATPPTAASLMQQAHDGRAVWKNFPGFQAQIRATVDGSTVEGTLRVSDGGAVTVTIPQDDRFVWATGSLKSLVGHRLSSDDAITTVVFADEQQTHPLGRLLKSTGDADKSLWRVQGDVLTEVHRFGDKTRFIISIADVARNAEGKHLPKNFNVTTWDLASGQIKTSRQVYNEWARVGEFDLPARLLAVINKDDGSRRVEQIELREHELLSNTKTAATP